MWFHVIKSFDFDLHIYVVLKTSKHILLFSCTYTHFILTFYVLAPIYNLHTLQTNPYCYNMQYPFTIPLSWHVKHYITLSYIPYWIRLLSIICLLDLNLQVILEDTWKVHCWSLYLSLSSFMIQKHQRPFKAI